MAVTGAQLDRIHKVGISREQIFPRQSSTPGGVIPARGCIIIKFTQRSPVILPGVDESSIVIDQITHTASVISGD